VHELAIAESVIAITEKAAAGRHVTRVHVKVGHLRQVVPSALTFSFELLAKDTPLQGAELALEHVPAVGWCSRCERQSELEVFPLVCESCGALDVEILRGEELYVDSLELEDVATV
jgi:hydrogenase nickel incorporation protein HypA/HybF